MRREIMCVLCPNSCELKIEYDNETKKIASVKGNKCKRGIKFSEQEILNPMRTLTFNVLVDGGSLPLVSTRSKQAMPFSELIKTAEQLKKIRVAAPVNCGDAVYKNEVCTIIATKNISTI